MAILQVENIQKSFGKTSVLKGISFSLEEGKAMAIIGSSGSGKTTLLRCLNFLETPDEGTIQVRDEVLFNAADPSTQREAEVRKKRLHFGLVFQSFHLFPQYTALRNVMLAKELLAQERSGYKANRKEILAENPAGGAGPAGSDGTGRPGGALSPPALRRPAAAGGHRPGAGPASGHPLF